MKPPRMSSRYVTAQAEAEAVGRARRELGRRIAAKLFKPIDPDGSPHRETIIVQARPGVVWGRGYQRVEHAKNKPAIDPATGYQVPEINPRPLSKAFVLFEFVPSTNTWEVVTSYPQ